MSIKVFSVVTHIKSMSIDLFININSLQLTLVIDIFL